MMTDAVRKALGSPAMNELEETVFELLRKHPDLTVADIEYDPFTKSYKLRTE